MDLGTIELTFSSAPRVSDAEAHDALSTHDVLRALSEVATPRELEMLEGRARLDELLGPSTEIERTLRVRRVSDLDELRDSLTRLGADTSRELLSLHAGEPPLPEQLVAGAQSEQEMLDRGVSIQVVYPSQFAQIDYLREFVQQQCDAGAVYRFADAVPYRLIVSDGVRAVVPHVATDERAGAIFTSEIVIVRALRQLAVSMLRRGIDLASIDAAGQAGPTEMEQKVIRAMSLGLTDEAAAKRLEVSERTFRRHAASVMQRLGAVSRFQAGVRAVERGWL